MSTDETAEPMHLFGLWLEREGVTDAEVADDLPAIVERYVQDITGEAGTRDLFAGEGLE